MSPTRAMTDRALASGFGFLTKARTGFQKLATAQIVRQRERSASAKRQNGKRVVVLGAPRVGKSAILRRFLREGFEESYEPTREDFHRKVFHIRGESYLLDVLDASGERDFPAKRRLSILTGDVFLVVFSVDDRASFEEARALRTEIFAAEAALTRRTPPRVPALLVCANKSDLPEDRRAVSRAEAAREFSALFFFETSARDGESLDDAFATLAERAGLPVETGPGRHRRLSMRSYHALRGCGDAPCGALHPLARRPSFGTDLKLVLGRKRSRGCRVQ